MKAACANSSFSPGTLLDTVLVSSGQRNCIASYRMYEKKHILRYIS